MGWDITFHPISERELQRFVFDVLDTPSLLDERVAELCPNEYVRQDLRELYAVTLQSPTDSARRWLAAAVAHQRHPSWASRDAGLQFAHDAPNLSNLSGNYAASGFMTPADVREIASRIKAKDPAFVKSFGGVETQEWTSLHEAIDYAESRGFGLIEAYSATIGSGDEAFAETAAFRPGFLKFVGTDAPRESHRSQITTIVVCTVVAFLFFVGRSLLINPNVSKALTVAGVLSLVVAVRIAWHELSYRDRPDP
jgi:hypothetical protein